MSWHDAHCEWHTSRLAPCRTCEARPMPGNGPHCHCGSRAFHLCAGCKRGMHLTHTAVADVFGTNHPCACDLCVEVPDAA